jgi:hypothetical protein
LNRLNVSPLRCPCAQRDTAVRNLLLVVDRRAVLADQEGEPLDEELDAVRKPNGSTIICRRLDLITHVPPAIGVSESPVKTLVNEILSQASWIKKYRAGT